MCVRRGELRPKGRGHHQRHVHDRCGGGAQARAASAARDWAPESPLSDMRITNRSPAVAPRRDVTWHTGPLSVVPMRCGHPPSTPERGRGRVGRAHRSSRESDKNIGHWHNRVTATDWAWIDIILPPTTKSTHRWQGNTANQSQTPPSLLQMQYKWGVWDFRWGACNVPPSQFQWDKKGKFGTLKKVVNSW